MGQDQVPKKKVNENLTILTELTLQKWLPRSFKPPGVVIQWIPMAIPYILRWGRACRCFPGSCCRTSGNTRISRTNLFGRFITAILFWLLVLEANPRNWASIGPGNWAETLRVDGDCLVDSVHSSWYTWGCSWAFGLGVCTNVWSLWCRLIMVDLSST